MALSEPADAELDVVSHHGPGMIEAPPTQSLALPLSSTIPYTWPDSVVRRLRPGHTANMRFEQLQLRERQFQRMQYEIKLLQQQLEASRNLVDDKKDEIHRCHFIIGDLVVKNMTATKLPITQTAMKAMKAMKVKTAIKVKTAMKVKKVTNAKNRKVFAV